MQTSKYPCTEGTMQSLYRILVVHEYCVMNLASTLADNSASSLGPWWIVLYVRKSREGISYLLSYNCTVLCYYVGNHTNYPILYQLTYEHLNRSVGYAVNLALHIVVQTKAPVCTFRNTLIVMEGI